MNQATSVPLVLRQAWIVVMPQGAAFESGYSYHLSPDGLRILMDQITARLSTDVAAEREEPQRDPEWVEVPPELYQKIKAAADSGAFGVRSK